MYGGHRGQLSLWKSWRTSWRTTEWINQHTQAIFLYRPLERTCPNLSHWVFECYFDLTPSALTAPIVQELLGLKSSLPVFGSRPALQTVRSYAGKTDTSSKTKSWEGILSLAFCSSLNLYLETSGIEACKCCGALKWSPRWFYITGYKMFWRGKAWFEVWRSLIFLTYSYS